INIHLYRMKGEGVNIDETMIRWEDIINTLHSNFKENKIIIGEIGYPRSGIGSSRSVSIHSSFLKRICNNNVFQSVDKIYFSLVFSELVYLNYTDYNCDSITAEETNYGFLNFRTGVAENQMRNLFFHSDFFWTHL